MFKIVKNNVQKFTVDLATFTKEILNGKLHFLCCVILDTRSVIKRFFRFFEILLSMSLE